ncbi:MAG: hypothetical protein LBN04_05910 [Oscillospiraceae bacterium]|nr:hypothetical protein [Oscillospiraceae bacterium]
MQALLAWMLTGLLALMALLGFGGTGAGAVDADALPMIDGYVQREDNWVIQKVGEGEQYYKLAEYTVPDGYYRDTESSTSTNKNRAEFWMRPVDKTSAVKYGYVIGVAMPPEEIAAAGHDALVGFNQGESIISDVSHATLRGIEVPYFTNIVTNQRTGEVNKQLNAYLPAPHNAGVMVAVSVLMDEAHPEPSDEELLALTEFFAATLKLEE